MNRRVSFYDGVLAVEDCFRQHGGETLEGLIASVKVHWVATLITHAAAIGLGVLLGGLP